MNEIDPAVAMHQHTTRAPRMRSTRSGRPERNASLPPPLLTVIDKSVSHSRRQPTHQIDAPDVHTTARSVPVDIVAAAEQPGADPCDICCEAMPAHVIGDLTPPENAWLVTHTDTCNHCASVLHRYEKVDAMLDRLQGCLDSLPAPPPFIIPKATKFPTTSTRSRVSARAARRTAHFGMMESPVGPLRDRGQRYRRGRD